MIAAQEGEDWRKKVSEGVAGLFSEYRHSIDAKGRLAMPAKLLKVLDEPFFVSISEDNCLNVYTLAEWEKLEVEKFGQLSGAEERQSRRKFYSAAQDCIPDAQGRIILSQKLRSHAGLDRNVVIAGAGKYAEIWDAARWDELEG
jgi:MraZ protein